MTRRLIDLSVAIENDIPSDPAHLLPRINYMAHGETFPQIASFFPGLAVEDLPDGEAWAVETLEVTTHSGTHMDAPWHYHSTAGGEPAPTIDQTPLEMCFQPGVKLDFRHCPDGYVVTKADVIAELARINHQLRPLEIVLTNTSAGARYGKSDFLLSGCGIGREATLYLLEQGIKLVGTDAWSWDAPFAHTAQRYARNRDASIIWEGHKAGREVPYWQMEKLANLALLPATGFDVICFPVNIKNAGAGWVRAVALMH